MCLVWGVGVGGSVGRGGCVGGGCGGAAVADGETGCAGCAIADRRPRAGAAWFDGDGAGVAPLRRGRWRSRASWRELPRQSARADGYASPSRPAAGLRALPRARSPVRAVIEDETSILSPDAPGDAVREIAGSLTSGAAAAAQAVELAGSDAGGGRRARVRGREARRGRGSCAVRCGRRVDSGPASRAAGPQTRGRARGRDAPPVASRARGGPASQPADGGGGSSSVRRTRLLPRQQPERQRPRPSPGGHGPPGRAGELPPLVRVDRGRDRPRWPGSAWSTPPTPRLAAAAARDPRPRCLPCCTGRTAAARCATGGIPPGPARIRPSAPTRRTGRPAAHPDDPIAAAAAATTGPNPVTGPAAPPTPDPHPHAGAPRPAAAGRHPMRRHTQPWHLGGLTCECGLAPLCRHIIAASRPRGGGWNSPNRASCLAHPSGALRHQTHGLPRVTPARPIRDTNAWLTQPLPTKQRARNCVLRAVR